MRRLGAAMIALSLAGPAFAAPAEESCLIREANVFWAHVQGKIFPSWVDAAKAAGAPVTAGVEDPFFGEAAVLVGTPRGEDLFVKGARGVIRFADTVPTAAKKDMDWWVTSVAKGPWVVVSVGAREILPAEDMVDGLESHPPSFYTQWLVDGRTGRVVVTSDVSLPFGAGPDGPEWELTDTAFTFHTYDDTGTRPFADIARCAGTDADPAAKIAGSWIELGRKLTKTSPGSAWTAFSQALSLAPELAEAWSGRGYAQLQVYLEERKKSPTSIGNLAAIGDFEEAAKRSKDPKFLAQVWYNIGEARRLGCESNLPRFKREPLGEALDAYKRSLGYADREAVKAKIAEIEAAIAALPAE